MYALNTREERKRAELEGMACNPDGKPWLILGVCYFNQALNPQDSSADSGRVPGSMEDFRSCLLKAELSDLTKPLHLCAVEQ